MENLAIWQHFASKGWICNCVIIACGLNVCDEACMLSLRLHDINLVDPASSHMLVSKIKPCMSQYKLLHGETANGSLKQLSFIWWSFITWITMVILELIHAPRPDYVEGLCLYWDMHGLIFETSIWLLAGSTRFLCHYTLYSNKNKGNENVAFSKCSIKISALVATENSVRSQCSIKYLNFLVQEVCLTRISH